MHLHAYSEKAIGDRVIIHPGARIGQDGFGYLPGPRGHQKVPQTRRVIIQDDVEIGANTTIFSILSSSAWITSNTAGTLATPVQSSSVAKAIRSVIDKASLRSNLCRMASISIVISGAGGTLSGDTGRWTSRSGGRSCRTSICVSAHLPLISDRKELAAGGY